MLDKLNHEERKVLKHLKQFEPTLAKELGPAGAELEARRRQRAYEDLKYDLVGVKKLPDNQAEELAREERFPAGEKAPGYLGEHPESKDPTSATTTKSPKPTS
jgi:hypothetical protein